MSRVRDEHDPVGCSGSTAASAENGRTVDVIIVDDDPGIREALCSLIRSVDIQAKALASVPEFLDEGRPDGPTRLVLDVL
jgi:FixJ family two-component response regulator